jgi:CRISPR-associated exonuclease Cas4
MFDEDDLIPISALQHYLFCARQCALIHLEQAWSDNRLTAEGRIMHERAHEAQAESRGAVRIERGVALVPGIGPVGKAMSWIP